MPFMTPAARAFAEAVSKLVYCNPFRPERIQFERDALGSHFTDTGLDWNVHPELTRDDPNVGRLIAHTEHLVRELAALLVEGAHPSPAELALYEDLVLFALYHRYHVDFDKAIRRGGAARKRREPLRFYDGFRSDAARYLHIAGLRPFTERELNHILACFFQIRRAFHHIFNAIIGVSKPAARFRAAVWESIFTHDIRRYRRVLYDRMADFTTLITGPSGTGKELAARAIGLSRYVPFDAATRTFEEDAAASFYAVNLSALSPTLIESELFGHRRGSFTGAVADRSGWLEVCPALGTVFLDEIGDLDASIQLKLLRVLQMRTFQRIGDTRDLQFHGKIIAATNRDLAERRQAGHFREDFYYRLCSDLLHVPSLYERVRDTPAELRHLILFITRRLVDEEAESLANEVEQAIGRHLGSDYAWPGNVRELEQCVRNVLVRKEYRPARARARGRPRRIRRSGRLGGVHRG